jgi:hypothetical protein
VTLRDALDFALTSLRGNLAKSLLTVLGLGVGVGAVLTVLSLGDAGEIRVEEEIARLGVDKVWFCAENPAYPLTEDCRAIAASTGADVCLGASTMDAVSLGGQTVYAQIAGYDDGLETVHHPSSVQGRMFTVREYSGERVALLDETLAGRLNAAVGDFINCGGRRYFIVGVVAGMPAQSASLGSGMLLLPLQTWQDAYALSPTELALAVPKGEKAGELAEDVLAKLHNLPGKYLSVTLENEIDAAKSVVRIFVMVLACVAFVCVATGAIGVMNVLLISVRERRREIGLLKAIGATSRQVALLFLLEAAAYAALGGLLGILLGLGMTALFGALIGLMPQVKLLHMGLLLAGAAALGLSFGVIPAAKAAGLPPAQALRTE